MIFCEQNIRMIMGWLRLVDFSSVAEAQVAQTWVRGGTFAS